MDKKSDMALLRSLVDIISDITTQQTTYIHKYMCDYRKNTGDLTCSKSESDSDE